MPAVNFSPGLAPLVERGEKRQTIRPRRKRPFRVGQPIHAYQGMRTKQCRKLGEWVIETVTAVHIDSSLVILLPLLVFDDPCSLDLFAGQDGFQCWADMENFFQQIYGLPFDGVLITWGGGDA